MSKLRSKLYQIVENENGYLVVRPTKWYFLIRGFIGIYGLCSLSVIFDEVKNIGKKEGYEEASNEYEKKFKAQITEFKCKQDNFQKDRKRYELLLDDYELRINEMLKIKELIEGKEPGYPENITDTTLSLKGIGITGGLGIVKFYNPSKLIEEIREEGRKEGYRNASIEYEKKLLKQVESFLKKEEKIKNDIVEYEELVTNYKEYLKKIDIYWIAYFGASGQ